MYVHITYHSKKYQQKTVCSMSCPMCFCSMFLDQPNIYPQQHGDWLMRPSWSTCQSSGFSPQNQHETLHKCRLEPVNSWKRRALSMWKPSGFCWGINKFNQFIFHSHPTGPPLTVQRNTHAHTTLSDEQHTRSPAVQKDRINRVTGKRNLLTWRIIPISKWLGSPPI